MTISPDQLYAAQQIFQDYCNRRDQIRRVAQKSRLVFTPRQEKQVLAMARAHFRNREMVNFKHWLCRFFAETNMYLKVIRIKTWPMMRGVK